MSTTLHLVVHAVTAVTPLVREVVLRPLPGRRLLAYAPGSHLVVTAGAVSNAYSLTGDGIAPQDYRISVLRRGTGGGSDWLHDNVVAGDLLDAQEPACAFAPHPLARKALLVAGGIGVTPVLSHLRAARAWGLPVEVVHAYRPGRGAHVEDVRRLAPGTLTEVHSRRALRGVLTGALARQPWGTHLYVCGPRGMIETTTSLAARAGWPAGRVHVERFVPPDAGPRRPFTARLRGSGGEVDVPRDATLLERLLDTGIPVPHLCRHGVCGRCRVPVARGEVEHRDLVLGDDERAAGTVMLACVSRARGDTVELDL